MSAADDFFANASGKSAKFPDVGATVTGKVVSFEQQQATDFDGKPKFWDNGDKVMQLKVGLQTDERSPDIEDDDGVRYLYVKGSKKPESNSMHAAVAGALHKAGAKLEVGGTLTVQLIVKAPSPNPKKIANEYTATYSAPDYFEQPATAPTTATAPAAAPVAAPSGPSPDDIARAKALIAADIKDPLVIGPSCPTLDPAVIAALVNAA